MRQIRGTAVPALVRLGVVLVLVLSVFGMQALFNHGSTHDPVPTALSAAGAMSGASGQAHAGHGAAETSQHAAPGPAPDPGAGHGRVDDGVGIGGSEHSLGDVVMLCVAMLVAAATLLWLLNLLRRVPRMWAVLRPFATPVRPASWLIPTGTGPPPMWQFSVIRC